MRLELLYAPGCSSYKSARTTLERVIAEEGLPLPIEYIEESGQLDGAPTLRINGSIMHGPPLVHHIENLRDAICRQWKEITEKPLARLS
jgi:hypothetical protein